jgi:hypothetical protein
MFDLESVPRRTPLRSWRLEGITGAARTAFRFPFVFAKVDHISAGNEAPGPQGWGSLFAGGLPARATRTARQRASARRAPQAQFGPDNTKPNWALQHKSLQRVAGNQSYAFYALCSKIIFALSSDVKNYNGFKCTWKKEKCAEISITPKVRRPQYESLRLRLYELRPIDHESCGVFQATTGNDA